MGRRVPVLSASSYTEERQWDLIEFWLKWIKLQKITKQRTKNITTQNWEKGKEGMKHQSIKFSFFVDMG